MFFRLNSISFRSSFYIKFICLTGVIFSSMFSYAIEDTLLANGGFEKASKTNAPANWSPRDWSPSKQRGKLTVKCDIQDKVEGKQSARLIYSGKGCNLVMCQEIKKVVAGNYILQAKVKPSDGKSCYLSVLIYSGKKRLQYLNSLKKKSNGAWQKVALKFNISNKATGIRIILRSDGNALFDAVSLTATSAGLNTRTEPSNAKEFKTKKVQQELEVQQADVKRKAKMSAKELAWEKVLEENLGYYYLPYYKKAKYRKKQTAFDYVKDNPVLPRVLLIGDSISRAYTVSVRNALKGKVNIHHAPANCGSTLLGLKKLDLWLGDGKWDLIYFNFGIHDRLSTTESYVKRLEEITKKLKATGAKLVWATSTPLPADSEKYKQGECKRLNAAAKKIMEKYNIPISDLYALIYPVLKKHQNSKDCHFKSSGYRIMSDQVASSILANLKDLNIKKKNDISKMREDYHKNMKKKFRSLIKEVNKTIASKDKYKTLKSLLRTDGTFSDLSLKDIEEQIKRNGRKYYQYEALGRFISIALQRLCFIAILSPDDDKFLNERIYRGVIYYLDKEFARTKLRFHTSCFSIPHSASGIYLARLKDMDKVESAKSKDAYVKKANTYLKKAAFQAFSQPFRKDVPNPVSVEQFRKNGQFVGGNFGYRPLLKAALVCNSPKMIDTIVEVCNRALDITSWNTRNTAFWAEGITADGAGWGHGTQCYVCGYPTHGLHSIFNHLHKLKGTTWGKKIDSKKIKIIEYYINACIWFFYGYECTLMSPGRIGFKAGVFMQPKSVTRTLAQKVSTLLPKNSPDKNFYKNILKMDKDRSFPVYGVRYFWNNDSLIERKKNYYLGIKMVSKRSSTNEVVGWKSATSFSEYLGDGSTFLMNRPGAYKWAKGFWNYTAIPGTTTRQHQLKSNYTAWRGMQGATNFAGGLSDGQFGCSGFIYEKAFQKAPKNPYLWGVSAHKSYFLFDDLMLCLGAGITNKKPELTGDIWTSVNQAEVISDAELSTDMGKTVKSIKKGNEFKFQASGKEAIIAIHDQIGYAILPDFTNAPVSISIENRKSHWKKIFQSANALVKNKPENLSIFEIHINHGRQPKKNNRDSYSYIIKMQCKNILEMKQILQKNTIKILANNKNIQAASNDSLKLTQAIIYNPKATLKTKHWTIKASAPIVLMVREKDNNEFAITLNDPMQNNKLNEVFLTSSLNLSGPGARQIAGKTLISFSMPKDPYCGKSITKVFVAQAKN
jgi:chondroitin AC lyase